MQRSALGRSLLAVLAAAVVDGAWRLRSTSHGELGASASVVHLLHPAEGLLLRLIRNETLHGRLLSASGLPLAGALLSAKVESPDAESPERLQTQTDDEGRFELSLRNERISHLDLRLGGAFRESLSLWMLDAAALPADGDLGVVFVDGLRDVPFLLRAPSGEPIASGTTQAAGARSAPTGKDGRGVLRWLPLAIEHLRAEAPGFVPAEVELAAVLPDPLVIELAPANLLEVHIVPPDAGDPRQFRVVLRREEGVAAGPVSDAADQAAHVGEWTFAPVDLMQAPPASFLAAMPSADDGVAVFRALQVDVSIELEVRGITGTAVYQRRTLEPLRTAESRRIEIVLDEGIVVFRGRVLDPEGVPLPRAMLQLDGQILGWTDEQGAFQCFLVEPRPGTLLIQHQACSTTFLHDYAVPTSGREVEFRLQPARRVTIEVVDATGRPVPQAEVWIRQEGFIQNTHRIEANRHIASSLTERPFQIEVRLAGRKYVKEHSPDVPEARVLVPVHGSVMASVSGSTTRARAGRLSLVLEPTEGDGDALVEGRDVLSGELSIEISAVLPGRYDAYLLHTPTDDERAAGREEQRSASVSVTVKAEQRTELRLDID